MNDSKLQFSELRYRRLFETAQDGILILDADTGKIVDVNPFLKKLLGFKEKELLNQELWQIGVFKDIFDSKKAFAELQNTGYIRYKDLPLVTKDHKKIDVEFISNVYMVDKEKVIQCNIRDITDRRIAEKRLESNNRELEESRKAMMNIMEDLETAKTLIELEKVKDEAMLAAIGEGLVAADKEGKILVINKAAENMLGWKKNEVLGKKITFLPLADEEGNILPFNQRPTFKAIKTGKPVSENYFFIRKDKTRFPIAINVTPIKLAGKTIGILDIFRDTTHEREIDRAKSEFVSLASHQLRTPLGIVKWYIEALGNENYFKKAPLQIKSYFKEINKSNQRVLSLVRDLLSVSRIEQGRVKNTPRLADITTTITEVVNQMQIVAHKKGVLLSLNIGDSKIPPINIDILRFHEVIENLVGNAIEYTTLNGEIEVAIKKIKDNVLITVRDTGIGISESDQKRLFTKFFRSEKATQHNPEGSGLGLYLVKSYVEGWGGKITVQSTEEKGSKFSITLPLKMKGVTKL